MLLDSCSIAGPSSCCFDGRAETVTLEGSGPAVFADGAALSDGGMERVSLIGAHVGSEKGGPEYTLVKPELLEPLPMSCDDQPYAVTYRAGSPVSIVLDLDADAGKCSASTSFRGDAGANGCATVPCSIAWLGRRKTVTIERAGQGAVNVTSTFPYAYDEKGLIERGSVARVRIEGAHGKLRCNADGGRYERDVAGETCVSREDPNQVRKVTQPVRFQHDGIGIAFQSTGPIECSVLLPEQTPVLPGPLAFATAGVIFAALTAAAVVVARNRGLRGTPRSTRLTGAQYEQLTRALIDAFPPRRS